MRSCYRRTCETKRKGSLIEISTGFLFKKKVRAAKLSDGCDLVPGAKQFVDDALSDSKNRPFLACYYHFSKVLNTFPESAAESTERIFQNSAGTLLTFH